MSESQTTTVVLADEGTRRVLESALWNHAAAKITAGDEFDEDLSSVAVAVIGREDYDSYDEAVSEVDRRIEMLSFIRSEIDRLRNCAIGEGFVMPMSPDQICSILRHNVVPKVEEFEDFWNQPPPDRERMLASRDAGSRLLAELSTPEPVA